MSDNNTHARLGPSGADRWMDCLGSVILCKDLPDTTSKYADEGTDAHELGAYCLEEGVDAATLVGRALPSGNAVNDDMAVIVQKGYIDPVRIYATGGSLTVETLVPIGHLTGEEGAEGTADAIVIREDRELICIDLKYGMGVEVSPENNRQLMMYALGTIALHDLQEEVDTVRLVICQPRIGNGDPKEWVVSYHDLQLFAREVERAGTQIQAGLKMFAEHGVHTLPFKVTEKGCRFCKAKGTCPTLASHVQGMAVVGFENLDKVGNDPARIVAAKADGRLGAWMDQVGVVELWIKGVRAAVEAALLAGHDVVGSEGPYKLVQGRKGARKWADAAATETLFKQFRLKTEEMYDFTLISPTTAEKLLKKEHPRQWEKTAELITQSEGAVSVAPATDKRPAVVRTGSTEGFEAQDGSDLI